METKWEVITPEKASEYLNKNNHNRNLRKSLVAKYARDMAAGNWKVTHQGVAMNCDGTVLDGQHRLAAIIESGISVRMLVTSGIATDAQLVMDDHAKRNNADALSLLRSERVTTQDVAVVRCCVELTSSKVKSITKSEISQLIDVFAKPLAFVNEIPCSHRDRGVTAAPVKAAICLAWFYVDDLDRLAEFCRILFGADRAQQEGDEAAVMLRELMLSRGMKAGNGPRLECMKKTQRAIVAFMSHKPLAKLYATELNYRYPVIDEVRS